MGRVALLARLPWVSPLLDPQVAREVDYAIASSLVSGVGATATSNSPVSGPTPPVSTPSRDDRLATVREHDDIARLDVRRGVFEETEVAGGVVLR